MAPTRSRPGIVVGRRGTGIPCCSYCLRDCLAAWRRDPTERVGNRPGSESRIRHHRGRTGCRTGRCKSSDRLGRGVGRARPTHMVGLRSTRLGLDSRVADRVVYARPNREAGHHLPHGRRIGDGGTAGEASHLSRGPGGSTKPSCYPPYQGPPPHLHGPARPFDPDGETS